MSKEHAEHVTDSGEVFAMATIAIPQKNMVAMTKGEKVALIPNADGEMQEWGLYENMWWYPEGATVVVRYFPDDQFAHIVTLKDIAVGMRAAKGM